MPSVTVANVINGGIYYIPIGSLKLDSANVAPVIVQNPNVVFVLKFSFISTHDNILYIHATIGTDSDTFSWGAMDLTQNDFVDGLNTVLYTTPTPAELMKMKYNKVSINVENKAKLYLLKNALEKRSLTDVLKKISDFAGIKGARRHRTTRHSRSSRSRAKTRKYK